MTFERHHGTVLRARLREAPQRILVVHGPRQVGKSTLVRQALAGVPSTYVATDQPLVGVDFNTVPDGALDTQPLPGAERRTDWLIQQWTLARAKAREMPEGRWYVLAIDEIQKVKGGWSDAVKGLWDADRASGVPLHVVLLGSSPWLLQDGLSESLAGRYELLRMTHWSFPEMQAAFDFSLEEYLHFGGYPGSAGLIRDERRWREYVRSALVSQIERDILAMTRVDKPALLKMLFELACAYSGQIIAYTKLLGQLHDAGNTVTLAHYLSLLSQAGFVTGLSKYAGQEHRRRASPPKLNVLNPALVAAQSGYSFAEARNDRSYWGRLVETAVGAHLVNTSGDGRPVYYWRESPHEVDFVLTRARRLVAIEVKSGLAAGIQKGLTAFAKEFPQATPLVVGEGGIPLAEFLSAPAEQWLE